MGLLSRNQMEGHTDNLFTADGEMMDFELWEGMQKLTIDLLESKYVMIPKSKRDDEHAWSDTDTMALFLNGHRNKIMLRNLGNTGFQTYLTSSFYPSVVTDSTTMFLGHCRNLFAIPQSHYLARRNLQRRFQCSDETVRSFIAELRRLVGFCDYEPGTNDERLKGNLIVNAYSADTHKKLYAMPDNTPLNDIVKAMETLEQATHESKLGETAIGKSPLRSVCLQMVHCYRGRRDSDSADSDVDYESECGENSTCFESDDLTEFSDSDIQQTISSLETQLARLKTSVDKARTRKMNTQPRNFVKPAAQPVCSACGKNGHSKSDRKCPARSFKCHNCERLGHWSTVCRSPSVTGTSSGHATP